LRMTGNSFYAKLNPISFSKYSKYFGAVGIAVVAGSLLVLPKLADYYAQVEMSDEINEIRRQKYQEKMLRIEQEQRAQAAKSQEKHE